mmetsp:Transcript_7726/g.16569  ORF Transcript_7726/g.16569 Transcript_7726/m.16569 type:complete len:113 (+) Transcript_7726:25-363(+)
MYSNSFDTIDRSELQREQQQLVRSIDHPNCRGVQQEDTLAIRSFVRSVRITRGGTARGYSNSFVCSFVRSIGPNYRGVYIKEIQQFVRSSCLNYKGNINSFDHPNSNASFCR